MWILFMNVYFVLKNESVFILYFELKNFNTRMVLILLFSVTLYGISNIILTLKIAKKFCRFFSENIGRFFKSSFGDFIGFWFSNNRYKVVIRFFSMASKLNNIHWNRTVSQPYWKIMCSSLLQTIFHEY